MVPPRANERLISVTELDTLAKGSFPVSVFGKPAGRGLIFVVTGLHVSEQNTIHCVSYCLSIKREHAGLRSVASFAMLWALLMAIAAPTGAVSVS